MPETRAEGQRSSARQYEVVRVTGHFRPRAARRRTDHRYQPGLKTMRTAGIEGSSPVRLSGSSGG